ncbi:hypothetical protein DAMA08_036270 [Martiniozyma asiatica (nom. inval.)]|nr:hypothetical protein DAMA08_036270 [Martiniozyma asiatica]
MAIGNEIFNQSIVIDNGSGMIKAGYAGDDFAKIHHSNIIGMPKYEKIKYIPSDIGEKDQFVGNEAQKRRGLLKLEYPLHNGTVENWDSLEIIWQEIFKGLSVSNSKEHPVLITEAPLNARKNRKEMVEILFENFNCPAVYVALPPVLSLYATGKTTGVVLDSGDTVTSIVPVYDGFAVPGSLKRMNIAGRNITKVLQRELMKDGYLLNSSGEFEVVRNLKERLGRVSANSLDLKSSLLHMQTETGKQEFRLPDGKIIHVGANSIHKSTEILFQPQIIGSEEYGIHHQLNDAILKTDVDLRAQLFENIVLAGGSTMYRNFGARVLKELHALDTDVKLKMYASPGRKTSAFIGGSILASLSTFKNLLITKSQYKEDNSCIYDKFI